MKGALAMSDKSEKKNHTLLKIVGTAAAAGVTAYAGISAYIFREVFDLQHSSLYSGCGGTAFLTFTDPEKTEWYEHSEVEDVFIDSFDGLKLHGLRMENHPETHNWVLLMFGPGCYDHNLLDYIYELDHAGYNVLAADPRGCGKSEGRYTTLGWSEHYDAVSWINHLVNKDHDAKIALFGISIGGAAVMNAVGDYLPSNVVCAIEEGGFSEMKEVLRLGITKAMKADGKFILPGLDLIIRQKLHFSIQDISTARQLKQAAVPMLFVQGTSTEFVPESMLFDNYYACGSDKQLLTAAEAEEGYFEKIIGYLNHHFTA